ncbi:MAG: hypothetical protein IT452_20120 [Planctomycetia bacterium]|nr:hypothetical protein [Planctomycetia bacterium]
MRLLLVAALLALPARADDLEKLARDLGDPGRRDAALESLQAEGDAGEAAVRAALSKAEGEAKARLEEGLAHLEEVRAKKTALREERAAEGRGGRTAGLAMSRDGSLVAYAGDLGDVEVRRTSDGAVVCAFTHEGAAWGLAFSPDGKRLGTDDAIYEVATGRKEAGLEGVGATAIAWSPDGALIAARGAEGGLLVFDAASLRQLRVLRETDNVCSYSWTGSGAALATLDSSRNLQVFDAMTGDQLGKTTRLPRKFGEAIAYLDAERRAEWSREGLRIAGREPLPGEMFEHVAAGRGCIAVACADVVRVLSSDGSELRRFAWSGRRGGFFAVAGPDGPVAVASPFSVRLRRAGGTLDLGRPRDRIVSVAFSPDARWVGASNGREFLLLGPEGAEKRAKARPMAVGAGEKGAEFVTADGRDVRQWDADETELYGGTMLRDVTLGTQGLPWTTFSLARSPRGDRLAIQLHGGRHLVPLDLATGPVTTWADQTEAMRDTCWHPDGSMAALGAVAEGCADGADLVVAGGPAPEQRLPGCSGAWSPDGKIFAWVDRMKLHVADGATLRELRAFDAPRETWLRFAGSTLVLTHDHRTLRFWSVLTGRCLRELEAGPLAVVTLSPDGKRLAAGMRTGEVKIFDLR